MDLGSYEGSWITRSFVRQDKFDKKRVAKNGNGDIRIVLGFPRDPLVIPF